MTSGNLNKHPYYLFLKKFLPIDILVLIIIILDLILRVVNIFDLIKIEHVVFNLNLLNIGLA